MATLRGTGMAAVNYPTGMNLGGDPSQALIHATTSGSFNVVLAAADLGQGLRTVMAQIAAETLGRPVRPDRGRDGRHGHRTPRHGHVRQPGDPPGGERGQGGGHRGARRLPAARLGGAGGRRERPRARRRGRCVRRRIARQAACDRGPRVARPVPVRAHDRRSWRVDEAQERGGPGDRCHGPGLDAGLRVHRRRGGGGHGDRRRDRALDPVGVRGGPHGEPGPGPGPDHRRRLDGDEPRPVRDHGALLPGPRPQPQGLRGVPDAGPGRAARSSRASCWRCRPPTARTASRAWAR